MGGVKKYIIKIKVSMGNNEKQSQQFEIWLIIGEHLIKKLRDVLQGWRVANQLQIFENILVQVSFVSFL